MMVIKRYQCALFAIAPVVDSGSPLHRINYNCNQTIRLHLEYVLKVRNR